MEPVSQHSDDVVVPWMAYYQSHIDWSGAETFLWPPLLNMPLCEKDQLVLDTIFNPLQLGGGVELDSWMVPGEGNTDAETISAPDDVVVLSEDQKKALQLETEAILLAEQKEYEKSIGLFSQAIELHPTRANTYNNRAQAYRLDGKDECE